MKEFLNNIKSMFGKSEDVEQAAGDEYVELDTSSSEQGNTSSKKIIIRPFAIEEFEDIKDILQCLREGRTIALVNIRPIKEKDLVELKRAVNKLKKTTDAIDGQIAGFGEDYVVITPNFAQIYKPSMAPKKTQEASDDSEIYDE